MLRKVNPGMEYVINRMRKLTEDKKVGIVKTDAQRKADALRVKAAMAASDAEALRDRPNTWSANMPAYAYTELCPDPDYRR